MKKILWYTLAIEAVWLLAIAVHAYSGSVTHMLSTGFMGSIVVLLLPSILYITRFIRVTASVSIRAAVTLLQMLGAKMVASVHKVQNPTQVRTRPRAAHNEEVLLQDGVVYRVEFNIIDRELWYASKHVSPNLEEALRREIFDLKSLCDFDSYEEVTFLFPALLFAEEATFELDGGRVQYKLRNTLEKRLGIKIAGFHFVKSLKSIETNTPPAQLQLVSQRSLWKPELGGV